MKFGSGLFEIQGINTIVENTVRIVDGKKIKEGETFAWGRAKSKGTDRWLKFVFRKDTLILGEVPILGGMSLEQMHDYIEVAMVTSWQRVWFSNATCNIETNLTIRDAYRKKYEVGGMAASCISLVESILRGIAEVFLE